MAEEKKPKIDLKTRLQKMGAGANIPPTVASSPAIPVPRASVPAPMLTPIPPAVPPPPGLPTPPPPALDPSNPLAAVAKPFTPSAAPSGPAVAAPHKIEVDEGAVHQARSATVKRMLLVTAGVSVVLATIGFFAGRAAEKGSDYDRAKKDIELVKGDVVKAKGDLEKLTQKLVEGKKVLAPRPPPPPAPPPAPKFPDGLSKDLQGIVVDFDGSKLSGKRFTGLKGTTMVQLVEFVTAIEAMKEKKRNLENRLTALQKPLTEELAARQAATEAPIEFAVVFDVSEGASRREALLAPFAKAFQKSKETPNLPDKLKLKRGDREDELPYWATGKAPDKTTSVALPVFPGSFNAVCPNPTKGQYAKLVSDLNGLKDAIKQDDQPEDGVREEKLDLVERANRLITALDSDIKGG